MIHARHLFLFCKRILILLAILPQLATAQQLYWADGTGIHRAEVENGATETLIEINIRSLNAIAVDTEGGKMYWADEDLNKISRANLDGSQEEVIIGTGLDRPKNVTLDLQNDKIYFFDLGTGRLLRANFDGSEIETIDLPPYFYNAGPALDLNAGKVYTLMIYNGLPTLQSAHLDGSDTELIFGALPSRGDLKIDPVGGKLYVRAEIPTGPIMRSNLDGTDVETLYSAAYPNNPRGLHLDLENGKMYWPTSEANIYRANLDGTEIELVLEIGEGGLGDVFVDTEAGMLYWMDEDLRKIGRVNLDGTGAEDLVTTPIRQPVYLLVDEEARKLYWTEPRSDAIMRANLDGSEMETVIEMSDEVPIRPAQFDIDFDEDMIYWTQGGRDDHVARAALDGSFYEVIVSDLSNDDPVSGPFGITIDDENDKLYWTDNSVDVLFRSNLDGTDVEEVIGSNVVERFSNMTGVALDPQEGKVFWADGSAINRIYWANLDGSELGFIPAFPDSSIDGHLLSPYNLVIDHDNRKMYWQSEIDEVIYRANLDGTDLESFMTDRPFIEGLALSSFVERVSNETIDLPGEVFQLTNYPNPFSESTQLQYVLKQSGPVSILVYDMLGRRVASLVDHVQVAGEHQVIWDGRAGDGQRVARGIYIIEVNTRLGQAQKLVVKSGK